MEKHQLGVFRGLYSGERDFGDHRRHCDYERDASERDAAEERDWRAAGHGGYARRHSETIYYGKLYAVHRGRSDWHRAGLSCGAGAADVHAVSRVGAHLSGGDGRDYELRSGIVFWDLSGAAGGKAGSRGRVEV